MRGQKQSFSSSRPGIYLILINFTKVRSKVWQLFQAASLIISSIW